MTRWADKFLTEGLIKMMAGGTEVVKRKDEDMPSKEVVTISLNILVQLIESYVRVKTKDQNIILTIQDVKFVQDANHRIESAEVVWRKTYK